MKKRKSPILRRKQYDHPEHHREQLKEYSSEDDYVPEQLKDLLLNQCGHRCSVCNESLIEFHHIIYLENGGKTEYENLIVLCPNCHARVHNTNIPNERQLRHYKLKQEVTYGLPVISRLSCEEKKFILKLSEQKEDELVLFVEQHQDEMSVKDEKEALKLLRTKVGLLYLENEGIIRTEYGDVLTLVNGNLVVSLNIRITEKGIRWLRYLKSSEMVGLFCGHV